MPYIQQARPTQQKVNVFELADYSVGLNNVKSPFIMEQNESPNILNMIALEKGSIETRPGLVKWINTVFPEVIDQMFIYETTTFSYLLLSCGTKLYRYKISDGTYTLLDTTANVISGFQQDESFFYVDGTKYKEYNGTTIYEILDTECLSGIAVASASSTITLQSTCSAVNSYYNTYQIKIVSGTGINQVRTITGYVGSTKVATINTAWTINPDTTSIYYISKTTAGQTTTSGSTKIYSPTYELFVQAYYGDNNIDDIKKCRRIIFHKQRIWFSNHSDYQNLLYSTDIANPYYVPVSQWQPIISNDDDSILGCMSFNDVLVVFKNSTINAIYGFDYNDLEVKEVTVSCGTASIDTVCKADNYLLYLGSNGRLYSLYDLRTDVKKLATKDISVDKIDLQRPPINVHSDDWSSAKAVYFDKYYLLFIGNKTLVFDKVGWFLWDNITPTSILKYNNTLLISDATKYIFRLPFTPYLVTETITATTGILYYDLYQGYLGDYDGATIKLNGVAKTFDKISNTRIKINESPISGDIITFEYLSMLGYNDNNVKYNAIWESKDLDLNAPTKQKQIRQFNITANTYQYYTSNINVFILVDYNQITTDYTINNQLTLFGTAKFGDKYITNNIVDSQAIRISKRGRLFRFKISNNTINSPIKIYNIYGEYFVKKRGV